MMKNSWPALIGVIVAVLDPGRAWPGGAVALSAFPARSKLPGRSLCFFWVCRPTWAFCSIVAGRSREPCPNCQARVPRDRMACAECGTRFPDPRFKGIEIFA